MTSAASPHDPQPDDAHASTDDPEQLAPARRDPRYTPRSRGPRRVARAMFYGHLWLGVAATGILLIVSITGILLNHKRGLGLMPDVADSPAAFADALPLPQLGALASAAVSAEVAAAGIDRMDVRPDAGLIKVRFNDDNVMEVTLDLATGAVLHVGERNDVFLEKLHSGEVFGSMWVLLSDAGAVMLLVALVSGYWLWLYPKSRL